MYAGLRFLNQLLKAQLFPLCNYISKHKVLIMDYIFRGTSQPRKCVSVSTCLCTYVCECACIHKVSPSKCLIMGVGSHSPAPQDIKPVWRRSEHQTSRRPPDYESPRRTTARAITPAIEKRAPRRGQHTPEHQEPPIHRQVGAPATGKECGGADRPQNLGGA